MKRLISGAGADGQGVDTRTFVVDLVSAFARFYMAYIWIKAGVSKLGQHHSVTQSIKGYEIFTPEWSDALATLIGPLEVAGGVLLLLGIFLRGSSKVAAIVLTLFMIGIAQAWARGLGIDCGCFQPDPGSDAQVMNYVKTLARDAFYMVLTVWTIVRPYRRAAIYS
ncbi:DoxX family protein [Corynebacterium incognita]|nr:DoxX family protein [Corynebacterium incognita]